MDQVILQNESLQSPPHEAVDEFDYSYVPSCARVAYYDDFYSAPRITEISPCATTEYIDSLATTIYEQAKSSGGIIPYTIIKEVAENFIHAQFNEIVVSIFNEGNTIRFSDQGPGIDQKEKSQQPGFSSATTPMKKYIRGVGSGLPIVKEYLTLSHGSLSIEDNIETGAVVTINMVPSEQNEQNQQQDRSNPSQNEYDNYQARAPRTSKDLGYTPTNTEAYVPQSQANMSPMNYPVGSSGKTVGYPYNRPSYELHETMRMNMLVSPLSQKERDILSILLYEGPLGITEVSDLTGFSKSTIHYLFKKLEEAGLVERIAHSKRVLTPLGQSAAANIG